MDRYQITSELQLAKAKAAAKPIVPSHYANQEEHYLSHDYAGQQIRTFEGTLAQYFANTGTSRQNTGNHSQR